MEWMFYAGIALTSIFAVSAGVLAFYFHMRGTQIDNQLDLEYGEDPQKSNRRKSGGQR